MTTVMTEIADRSAVHFTVVSKEITPDAICERLGIKCDSAIWKNTLNPSGNPKTHPLNIAIFRSKLGDSAAMEEHVQNILSRIKPMRKNIKSLPKSCILALHFNYRIQAFGGWSFAPAVLQELAELAVPCVFSLETNIAGAIRLEKQKRGFRKPAIKQ
jgi:hypothetical protein